MINKKWYTSKTMYFNILSLIVIYVQSSLGQQYIPVELQATILAVVNLILRTITNSNITT